MSTVIMRDEIIQVADALYWDAMGERKLIHTIVKSTHPLHHTINEEKEIIAAWANRIYVANQCAYIFTYAHRQDCSRKIDLFDESDVWNNGAFLIKNKARFYRVLESIQYNLYSNGGQCMLCAEDMGAMRSLMEHLASAVIGDYQRMVGNGA